MSDANMAIVTRFVTEFLGNADIDAADATLAPDVQGITGLKPTGPINVADENKATITEYVAPLPAESPV